MTKKILLKWLEGKKAEAVSQVNAQEHAAKAALLEEKLKRSKFDELVEYLLPRITEIHDKLETWHEENSADVGPVYYTYGSLCFCLHHLLMSNKSAAECLRDTEVKETTLDNDLKKRFSSIRKEVEKTYDNVAYNLNSLANAKLGMEYLESLGFDLTSLKAGEEKTNVTALAVPVNTQFLLIKEVPHEPCNVQ